MTTAAPPKSTEMCLRTIKIDRIKIPEDREIVGSVHELAQSIAEVGLLEPIVVDKRHVLRAGLHRLRACQSLGWESIPCVERDDLDGPLGVIAECDENLCRRDIVGAERVELVRRRLEAYTALHPGAAIDPKRVSAEFIADTAAKAGVTPRSVEQDMQIAEHIDPVALETVRVEPAAASKRKLLELSRKAPAAQRRAAKALVKEAQADRERKASGEPKPRKPKSKTETMPATEIPLAAADVNVPDEVRRLLRALELAGVTKGGAVSPRLTTVATRIASGLEDRPAFLAACEAAINALGELRDAVGGGR